MRNILLLTATVFVSLSCSSARKTETSSNPSAPTKADLLAGAWVPERREFPVNPGVSPCQDFYKYSCSKVLENFKLRDDRSRHAFAFSDSAERMLTAKQNYLTFLSKAEPASPRGQALKSYFSACMNEKASAHEERELVAQEVKSIEDAPTREAFVKLLSDRLDQPEESFLGYNATMPNQADPLRRDLTMFASLMSMPEKTYYDKPELVQDLKALYTDLFKALGLPNAETRAAAVVDLEMRFAKKYPLPREIRDRFSEDRYVTKADVLKRYPNLGLARFLERVPEATQVREVIPEALSFVNQAVLNEPLPLLKDTLIAHSLPEYMDDAYPEFFSKQFAFRFKHLGGPKTRPVRAERCTRALMGRFDREIDAELLPILFPDFPEQKVVALAEKIRASLLAELKKNTWLSKKGRAAAIKKMESATLLVAKPQNDEEWDFNPPVEYLRDRPYENSKRYRKARIEKELREVGEARNRRRWLMGPLTVNAYYVPADNTFVLPVGILQYPFFDANAPEATNIAAIGSVIGHELGHGIDDKGSKYDEKGLLRQWMTAKDLKEFEKRGAKFIPRFEKLEHDGKLTMGENIGDHVGITAAYSAAFGAQKPARDLQQAFFVQYARSWCNEMRPSMRQMLLKTDPHALGDARVNEQVLHLDGFYEAFQCKAGDGMYLAPKDRVRIW